VGPAPEGKQTATGVRGGPSLSIKIERRGSEGGPNGSERVRAVQSESDEGNQTGKDERLQMALTGGTGRVRRACAKRPGCLI
jgi:hypothetical protein